MTAPVAAGVLVVGVGNVLLGDDGFGVEVARRLAAEALPDGVTVADYGIRGLHLAFELLDPPDLLVVIDATSRGEPPGTLFVLEPDLDALPSGSADAHGMDLTAVFANARAMGAALPPVLVVGCEPASIAEGIGLSEPVRQAVPAAAELVRELLNARLAAEPLLEVQR